MTLDKDEHKQILLQLIDKATFPGEFAEAVVELKKSVREASILKRRVKKPD